MLQGMYRKIQKKLILFEIISLPSTYLNVSPCINSIIRGITKKLLNSLLICNYLNCIKHINPCIVYITVTLIQILCSLINCMISPSGIISSALCICVHQLKVDLNTGDLSRQNFVKNARIFI